GVPGRWNGGTGVAPQGPRHAAAGVPPDRRQNPGAGSVPRRPARPLRRGPGRRGGRHARRRRHLPGDEHHGQALRRRQGASPPPARLSGAVADAPGHGPDAGRQAVMSRRWLIPLAAIPVLAVLAYGFRTDPRAIPSPLVGRPATAFALQNYDGKPVSLEG